MWSLGSLRPRRAARTRTERALASTVKTRLRTVAILLEGKSDEIRPYSLCARTKRSDPPAQSL